MQKLKLKNRRDQNIVGILTKPKQESKILGTAVLQHGYGGTKEDTDIVTIRDVFLKNGFQVFNFDTTHSFGESDGEYKDARLGLHADDFDDVANWVQKQDWFSGKLLVSGHSMGGFASARYALRNPELVDYTIPFAPVVSGELWLRSVKKYQPKRMKSWLETGFYSRESKSNPGRIRISPYEMMVEAQNHSLLLENNLNPDMLLIGCKLDTSCQTDHIQIFYDTLRGDKRFKIIRDSHHVVKTPDQLNQLKTIINSWLVEKI